MSFNLFNSECQHYLWFYFEHLSEYDLTQVMLVSKQWYKSAHIALKLRGEVEGECPTVYDKLKKCCLNGYVIRIKSVFDEMDDKFHKETVRTCKNALLKKCLVWSCTGGQLDLLKKFKIKVVTSTMFYEACKNNKSDTINYLLESISVERIIFGLFGASIGGHLEVLKKLIPLMGNRPFLQGCLFNSYSSNHQHITNYLETKYVCDGNMVNINNVCLNSSLLSGNMDVVEKVYKRYVTVLNEEDVYWPQKLKNACQSGNKKVIQFILNKINDLNNHNKNMCYEYGLKGASFGGHLDVVKSMINYGATNYDSAYLASTSNNNLEVCKYIESLKNKSILSKLSKDIFYKSFLIACDHGNLEMVKYFITKVEKFRFLYGVECASLFGFIDIVQYINNF